MYTFKLKNFLKVLPLITVVICCRWNGCGADAVRAVGMSRKPSQQKEARERVWQPNSEVLMQLD